MRPGQQWPRKRVGLSVAAPEGGSFNEAGATMAPETILAEGYDLPLPAGFNEAGATMAPETCGSAAFRQLHLTLQ